MASMKEVFIYPDLHITIDDAPIPVPGDNDIIVKIVVAGANPIDWKAADEKVAQLIHGDLKAPLHRNAGKDFAGYVHAVGSKVLNFKVGDRVIALNHSSGFAEYGVGPAHTTAHIPDNVTFEEAATTGLAYTTAALGLFKHLRFKGPWAPSKVKTPLLVYGASSATGAFTVKLAALANIHPIIAIAGKSGDIVSSILEPSKGDILLDYRIGKDALAQEVRKSAPELHYVVDSISNNDTVDMLSPLLAREESSYVFMLGGPHQERLPAYIKAETPFAPGLWEPTDPASPDGPEGLNIAPKAFTHAFFSYMTFALQEGLLKGHPYEVLPNGLASIGDGMVGLRDGKNSGNKYLFRIADTPGLGSK